MSAAMSSAFVKNSILNDSSVVKKMTRQSNGAHMPIIVFCHLRWDFVWQRPQQFLSRLSKDHNILFVEYPPLFEDVKEPTYRLTPDKKHSHITVLQLVFPHGAEAQVTDDMRLDLVKQALKGVPGQFEKPLLWFYDPMAAATYLGKMDESMVVYDCMDQLSQFRFAPPELLARERQLLAAADVVFAGGRKMWEDKKRHNANCHFYGCGVDVEHFGQARKETTEIPSDVAELSAPVAGYFGVVDERLDYDLIARLADENPTWNIVMVGPTCKVDPSELPQRSNLHWMGGRDYQELPAYVRAFDICLMPFALNEATEFINPTKALEYMATGTPIVSTPVPDVVSNFSEVVAISKSTDEFIALCRESVENPAQATIERGLRMAEANTWDAIVACLDQHIQEARQARTQKNSDAIRMATGKTDSVRSVSTTSTTQTTVSAVLVPAT